MEKESAPQVSPPSQQLRICRVQLRIVGESLGILQDFGKKLELTSEGLDQQCRVCFHEGTYRVLNTT